MIVYCFWTGQNTMSIDRIACLSTIPYAQLITEADLPNYILPYAPFHRAYPYLSETHKADYLRTYFMHHYGGGYADIKAQPHNAHSEWTKAFQQLYMNSDIWAIGYAEASSDCIAHPQYRKHYRSMIGNCAYVFRPHTPLTEQWYNQMHFFLDSVLRILERNPSRSPQDCAERKSGYPIEWNQMLGRVFHPLVHYFRKHIRTNLPAPLFHVRYR